MISSILLSACVFVVAFAGVYVIDPAGINNKVDLGLVKDAGLYNRTQKYVEIQKVNPNTLMFGGSRVQFLQTEDVKKYTNDKVYNLAFSISTLEEQYYFLKYSIKNLDIKNVVFGVNLYPFSVKLETEKQSDFDKDLLENGFSLFMQFKYYFEISIMQYAKRYINRGYKEPLYRNGSRTAHFQKILINNLPWEKRSTHDRYARVYNEYLEWGDSNIKIFEAMIELCKRNNVNVIVFTTAMHVTQFEILDNLNKMDIYYKWKRELASITPYYDFMYPNSVTRNGANFIDISHIRQEKGYLYFAKIFNDLTISVPDDFGIFVTKSNVEDHIKFLHKVVDSEIDLL